MTTSQQVNNQPPLGVSYQEHWRVVQERDYYKQQDRDKHDLLTNPTMDGDDIKVFYGVYLALFQVRKGEPDRTRADGKTLVRLDYIGRIINYERHRVGRHLKRLAEFGNGFLKRDMVYHHDKYAKDLYLDIDKSMRPDQFVVTSPENQSTYQPRKPKKYEHCSTPGCPCSAVQRTESTVLVCVDCSTVVKQKIKRTIIKAPQPYPDEFDEEQLLPAIEDQITEPLPAISVRIVPLDCSHHLLRRDRWKTTGNGTHCPVCTPIFDI